MNCTIDQERYSAPLPWIGLYITAASVVCSIAMLVDLFGGIRNKKLWFPSTFFSLNATSLALIAIATKLPIDINTPMPDAREQMTKLSGTAFICTAMGNFLPSLGPMEDSDLILNIVPLAILVITVIVNIGIQMGTGVIHAFFPEHIITLCFMLVMLSIICSSALALPTMKQFLNKQYELKREKISFVGSDDETMELAFARLKNDVKKFWMMALTYNPQYVFCRSCMVAASDFFCILETCVLVQAFIRALKSGIPCMEGTQSSSDYRWSVNFILFSQVFGVLVGVLGPLCRALVVDYKNAGKTKSKEHESNASSQFNGEIPTEKSWFRRMVEWKDFFLVGFKESIKLNVKIERYWYQSLLEWEDKEIPVPLKIQSRVCQKLIHSSKRLSLGIIRQLHIAVVVLSKLVVQLRLVLQSTSKLIPFSSKMAKVMKRVTTKLLFTDSTDSFSEELVGPSDASEELRNWVLHPEGKVGVIDEILLFRYGHAGRWIRGGRNNTLMNLMGLLKASDFTQEDLPFPSCSLGTSKGSVSFSESGTRKESLSCWALLLATLTSVAITVSTVSESEIKHLLAGVSEGLKFARLLDGKLVFQGKGMESIREAANLVWRNAYLYRRWLDGEHAALLGKDSRMGNVIHGLEKLAESYVVDSTKSTAIAMANKTSDLPPRGLATIVMLRVFKAIYVQRMLGWVGPFKFLCGLISKTLIICLTRLPHEVYLDMYDSRIEAMEERVREVLYLVGEFENILEAFGKERNQALIAHRRGSHIDPWLGYMVSLPELSHPELSDLVASGDEWNDDGFSMSMEHEK